MSELYDLVIVGAGPAGLSAALTASYLRLKHIVLESIKPGGALSHNYPSKIVDSYLGFRGMKGKEVANKMIDHVKAEGSEIKYPEEVIEIKRNKEKKTFTLTTNKGKYQTKSILLCTGTIGTPRKLGIEGEEKAHYVLCDPEEFKNKKCLVVGGGDSAVEAAVMLNKVCDTVFLAHRRDQLRAINKNQEELKKSNVKILWNTELKCIADRKVKVWNNKTGETKELDVDEVFIFIGSIPKLDFIKNLGIKMEGNHIIVNSSMQTSLQGVYAAGDITGKLKRIPEAIGEGHLAVYSIYKYLRNPYWT